MVDPIKTNSQVEQCTIWKETRDISMAYSDPMISAFQQSSSYVEETCHCPSDEPLDTEFNVSFFKNYQGHGFKDTGVECAKKVEVVEENTLKDFLWPYTGANSSLEMASKECGGGSWLWCAITGFMQDK